MALPPSLPAWPLEAPAERNVNQWNQLVGRQKVQERLTLARVFGVKTACEPSSRCRTWGQGLAATRQRTVLNFQSPATNPTAYGISEKQPSAFCSRSLIVHGNVRASRAQRTLPHLMSRPGEESGSAMEEEGLSSLLDGLPHVCSAISGAAKCHFLYQATCAVMPMTR